MTDDKKAESIWQAADIECPTCGAWVGWACEGRNYGYHAAGYHPARVKLAKKTAKEVKP